MAALNNSNQSLFQPGHTPAPRVTYGKQGGRPLSLTANQFKHHIYIIPPDAGDRTSSQTTASTLPRRLEGPRRKPSQPRHGKTRTKSNTLSTQRGLPANELLLVASALHYDDAVEPRSSPSSIGKQDPISDRSSSARKRRSPSSPSHVIPQAPLSVLRKRLKPPQLKTKLLHKLSTRPSAFNTTPTLEDRGRSGFEDSELSVKWNPGKVGKQSARKQCLLPGFSALQLQSGPLPNVKFEPPVTELKLETHRDDQEDRYHDLSGTETPSPRCNIPQRRLDSSARAREDLIRKEMASISVPARIPSEASSDSEEYDESEEEDQDQDVGNDAGMTCVENGKPNQSCRGARSQSLLASHARPVADVTGDNIPSTSRIERPDDAKTGVTLDFRQPIIPGELPRRSQGAAKLMEVNEAIVEVPVSDYLPANYPLGVGSTAHQSQHVGRIPEQRIIPQHPRPTLTCSTPAVPDSTTGPGNTQANTRRDSIVQPSESRYLSTAINTLRAPFDRTRHTIVSRRQSSYSDLLGTGAFDAVLETSPEADTDVGDWNVPRHDKDGPWKGYTPEKRRDPRLLARAGSKRHGAWNEAMNIEGVGAFASATRIR